MAAMDRLLSLITESNMFLILGIICIFVAAMSVRDGVVPGRGGAAYRAKNPKSCWFGIAFWLLGGVFCIGKFVYLHHCFSY